MSASAGENLISLLLLSVPASLTLLSTLSAHSYGMRFIAKVLKDSLHEKFPDAGEDELLKVRLKTSAHIGLFPEPPDEEKQVPPIDPQFLAQGLFFVGGRVDFGFGGHSLQCSRPILGSTQELILELIRRP